MNTSYPLLETTHFPVMLKEVIEICAPKVGGNYVDCTFGGGGYSKEILKFSNTRVIALDRDLDVKSRVSELKKKYNNRFSFYNNKFSDLDKVLSKEVPKSVGKCSRPALMCCASIAVNVLFLILDKNLFISIAGPSGSFPITSFTQVSNQEIN